MEELAWLEAERGNPEYVSEEDNRRHKQRNAPGKAGNRKRTANPAVIIAPAIVATAVSTAVVYCKVKDKRRRA